MIPAKRKRSLKKCTLLVLLGIVFFTFNFLSESYKRVKISSYSREIIYNAIQAANNTEATLAMTSDGVTRGGSSAEIYVNDNAKVKGVDDDVVDSKQETEMKGTTIDDVPLEKKKETAKDIDDDDDDQHIPASNNESQINGMKNGNTSQVVTVRKHDLATSHKLFDDDYPRLPKTTVAYAFSFIQCEGRMGRETSAGLIDSILVMRHSIHNISSRNPHSGSNYDYKIYAIVHPQAEECSKILGDMGFEIVVVDTPVYPSDIDEGAWIRGMINKEFCCGHHEFVKLYAYKLPAEIIVHVDIDFAFFKPMDHLFDAMLEDKDSSKGLAARELLELDYGNITLPDNRTNVTLPDKIGAFITRDWHQVSLGRWPSGFQGGFIVARRDPDVFDEIVKVVKKGDYNPGFGWHSGWGSKGYGGWLGAKAIQGVIAYYYDYIRTNNAVNLNSCRYNHLGGDVRYRGPPNFNKRDKTIGQCRNGRGDDCEDCIVTDVDLIYSAHYAICGKPWYCSSTSTAEKPNQKKDKGQPFKMREYAVNRDHCLELVERWHRVRNDLERAIGILDGVKNVTSYKPEIFHGHCSGEGNQYYDHLPVDPHVYKQIEVIYGENK